MELSVLDSSFHRKDLVEDWSSLVWTERFSTNGDFQLVSNNISSMLKLMPPVGPFDPPCMVSIRESSVPMIVESYVIEKPKNAVPQITITGRSFETFLDERQTLYEIDNTTTPPIVADRKVSANKPADAVLGKILEIVGPDSIGVYQDRIPQIIVTSTVPEAVPVPTTQPTYAFEAKGLYTWAMETLRLGTPDNSDAYVVTGNRGPAGIKSVLPDFYGYQIGVVIYEGTDRRESVVFEALLEKFDNTKYLLSSLGYDNVMVTSVAQGMKWSTTKADGSIPSGLSRRVGFQDLSSEITLPNSDPGWADLVKNRGLVALASNAQTVLFSGEIAERQAARYGVDYFLGDQVKLSGEYGLTQDVRIAEFVRSQDSSGIKAYPTFEAIAASTAS